MAAYYTYFISSLPMLRFGSKSALSLKDFLTRCAELIGDKECQLIRKAVSTDGFKLEGNLPQALLRWKEFDFSLRNELAKARSLRKKTEAARFLRPGGKTEMRIAHLAQSAFRQANILEGERYLDNGRWQELDEIASGHYFDLEFLLAYALKLAILERWSLIGSSQTGWAERLLGQ
jgi:hypothetical protein